MKEKEVTYFEKLKEQAIKDLQEYGELHENDCSVYQEDDCNCDMSGMKDFVAQWMDNVNDFWIEMAEAHRPNCSPEGNKMLTRMMGKKNRKIL